MNVVLLCELIVTLHTVTNSSSLFTNACKPSLRAARYGYVYKEKMVVSKYVMKCTRTYINRNKFLLFLRIFSSQGSCGIKERNWYLFHLVWKFNGKQIACPYALNSVLIKHSPCLLVCILLLSFSHFLLRFLQEPPEVLT